MLGFMKSFEQQTYALLRIVSGFLLFCHGTQKLLGFPPANWEMPWHIHYVAGSIELVGGFLIMIGLFTAPAAFLASGLTAFAYFLGHLSAEAWLPIMNRGDAAVLFCFVFLYISSRGAGIWSVDAKR